MLKAAGGSAEKGGRELARLLDQALGDPLRGLAHSPKHPRFRSASETSAPLHA